MADPDQLALLKRNVKEWNQWRRADPHDRVDLSRANLSEANLSGANLIGADLSGADLSGANLNRAILAAHYSGPIAISGNIIRPNLRDANLRDANLRDANLRGADLRDANLRDANLRDANLRGADLRGADLNRADFMGANLTGAKQGPLPLNSTAANPHPSRSSTTSDWLSLVETFGSNLLVTTATLASIIQGLDVIERRWREHKEKHKEQGTQTPQPAASSSQKIPAPNTEIVEILLVMDDGSRHGFKRWVSNPEDLRAYIDTFSDPTSKVKPLQVVFRKREGRALVVDVTNGGKDNKQLNAILGYLEA